MLLSMKSTENLWLIARIRLIPGKMVTEVLNLGLKGCFSVEKAALIGLVTLRYIECDENFSMRGDQLMKAIKQDRDQGLIPFWVSEPNY